MDLFSWFFVSHLNSITKQAGIPYFFGNLLKWVIEALVKQGVCG